MQSQRLRTGTARRSYPLLGCGMDLVLVALVAAMAAAAEKAQGQSGALAARGVLDALDCMDWDGQKAAGRPYVDPASLTHAIADQMPRTVMHHLLVGEVRQTLMERNSVNADVVRSAFPLQHRWRLV